MKVTEELKPLVEHLDTIVDMADVEEQTCRNFPARVTPAVLRTVLAVRVLQETCNEDPTPAMIARELHVTPQAVGKTVYDAMVMDLLTPVRDDNDKRLRRFRVTNQGNTLLDELKKVRASLVLTAEV